MAKSWMKIEPKCVCNWDIVFTSHPRQSSKNEILLQRVSQPRRSRLPVRKTKKF